MQRRPGEHGRADNAAKQEPLLRQPIRRFDDLDQGLIGVVEKHPTTKAPRCANIGIPGRHQVCGSAETGRKTDAVTVKLLLGQGESRKAGGNKKQG